MQGRRRRPLELFLLKEAPSRPAQELFAEAEKVGIPVRNGRRQDLECSGRALPSPGGGAAGRAFCLCRTLEICWQRWHESGRKAFFLVLDGITDPHNLGAIAPQRRCGRLSRRHRAEGSRLSGDRRWCDKASAGALEHIPLCQVTNLARTLED